MKKLKLLSLFMGLTFLLFGQQQQTTAEKLLLTAFEEAGITPPAALIENHPTTTNALTPPLEWLRDSTYFYEWDGDWYLEERQTYDTRDEYGNTLTTSNETTENGNTPWEVKSKTVSTYYNPTALATYTRSAWNTDTQEWVDVYHYNLDEDGNPIFVSILSWNYFNNSVNGGIQFEYQFDAGLVQELILYDFDGYDWIQNIRLTYTYNSENLMASETVQFWEQEWVNHEKIENEYNAEGLRTSTTNLMDPTNTNDWENASRTLFTYNNDDLVETNTYQVWENLSQSFTNQSLTEYAYTASLQTNNEFYFAWDEPTTSWLQTGKTEYTYNNSDLLTNSNRYIWNDPEWFEINNAQYEYDSNGNLLEDFSHNFNLDGELEWGARYFYEFDTNSNNTRFIAQVWDFSTESWLNTSRRDYFYSLQDVMLDLAELEDAQLTIYPNPSKGIFTITNDFQNSTDFTIRVTDISGRNIFTNTASGISNTIDLSDQASGLYFLYINNGTPQKIVINE